jgi:hypothetical protein
MTDSFVHESFYHKGHRARRKKLRNFKVSSLPSMTSWVNPIFYDFIKLEELVKVEDSPVIPVCRDPSSSRALCGTMIPDKGG